MCGLVALFQRDGAPVSERELTAARDSMRHRGPDECGVFLDGNVGLGHRRLNIIDLAGGHQPMANQAGTVHISFNGEIYNYRELRRFLESKGVRLRTQSDTETILGLYDLYGEHCVDHLRGMFAFVLWDAARRRLIAVRDRLGIKPLYMLRRGSTVAFASEIKALLLARDGAAEVAEDAIAEYLIYRNLAGTRTMFRNVERVAPGELWVFTETTECRRQYWRAPLPTAHRDDANRGVSAWADELDDLMRAVVEEHMISDVPLGAFNSGGVDSSLITAYTATHAHERLNTYSVGFDEPDYDERAYANIVAERFGTDHHTLVVQGRDYAEWLPRAIWHHDEPLNHPHSVHLALLSRLAREKVTVVLTGEGSDELFAGYPRYRLARLLDRFALVTPVIAPLLGLAARFAPERGRLRIEAVLNGGRGLHIDRLAAFVAPAAAQRVLSSDLASTAARRDGAAPAAPPLVLPQALWFDQETYLQSLLNRMDKMSMAASIEGRVPFLDHRVVEFAARVPPDLKIHGLETKFLLKCMARRHLPARIIDRRKAGFAVPVTTWLRPGGPLSEFVDLLLEPRTTSRGYLEGTQLQRAVEEHRSGGWDHGELLWGLINLELWQRLMIDTTATCYDPLIPPEVAARADTVHA